MYNSVLEFQIEYQTVLSDQELQTQLAPVVAMLDGVCETVCHNHGIPRYFPSGELCDAPDASAFRYVACLRMNNARLCTLENILRSVQPLLSTLLPSCTLKWNVAQLYFS